MQGSALALAQPDGGVGAPTIKSVAAKHDAREEDVAGAVAQLAAHFEVSGEIALEMLDALAMQPRAGAFVEMVH